VRRISPYYFLRHKVASSHERGAGSVFPILTISILVLNQVRRISPYYFLRHKVASSHERGAGSVFIMVQQFFDTEIVMSVVGCQKIGACFLFVCFHLEAFVHESPRVNPSRRPRG